MKRVSVLLVSLVLLLLVCGCSSVSDLFDRQVDKITDHVANSVESNINKGVDSALESVDKQIASLWETEGKDTANSLSWLNANAVVHDGVVVMPAWASDIPKPALGTVVGTVEMPGAVMVMFGESTQAKMSSYAGKLVGVGYAKIASSEMDAEFDYSFLGSRGNADAVVMALTGGDAMVVFYNNLEMATSGAYL